MLIKFLIKKPKAKSQKPKPQVKTQNF